MVAKNGAPLYITRVRYDGGVHAAKAAEFFAGSILAFGGKEVVIDVSYRLMVWLARNVLTLSAELRSIVSQLNELDRQIRFARFPLCLSRNVTLLNQCWLHGYVPSCCWASSTTETRCVQH